MVRRMLIRIFLTVLGLGLGVHWGNAQEFSRTPVPHSRFTDPYYASHTWAGRAGNRSVSLFALAARLRMAQQESGEKRMVEQEMQQTQSPYHQSRPGGTTASQYFGRSNVIERSKASPASAHSNRYRHFFGRRMRESGRREDQS